MKDELASVQISKTGLAKLGKIASYFRRSKTQQLEWMVDHDLADLEEMGVKFVVDLPHPAAPDAPAVPLAIVSTPCPHPPEAQQEKSE